MNFKDGDTITVNGKPCRIEGGALVPVVKRGPLGGELKMLADCITGEVVYMQMAVETFDRGLVMCRSLTEKGAPHPIFQTNRLIETNIPPRPTFTPMTAGEAAKLPDIVGRWVAVKVDEGGGSGPLPLSYGGISGARIYSDCQIMLIEGADL